MNKGSIIRLMALVAVAIGGWYGYESIQGSPDLPIQLVASNSLTNKEESLIIASPKDSKVEKVAVDDKVEAMINKDYSKRKVYKVTFNHTATESRGNLMVFVDTDKKTVVGKGVDEVKR